MSQASSQYSQPLHHVTATSPIYKRYKDSRHIYEEASNAYHEESSHPYHSRNETYQQAYHVPEDTSYADKEKPVTDDSPTLGRLEPQRKHSEKMAARQAFLAALEDFQQTYHPPTPFSKHRRLARGSDTASNDISLNEMLIHIQPMLGEVGLSVRWEDLTLTQGSVGACCVISHRLGEERGCRMVLPLSSLPEKMYVQKNRYSSPTVPPQGHSADNPSSNSSNSSKAGTQLHMGSESPITDIADIAGAMSFVKRYTLSSILGLWVNEDLSSQGSFPHESRLHPSEAMPEGFAQSTLRQKPSPSRNPSVRPDSSTQSKKSVLHTPPLKNRQQQGAIYTRRSRLRTHEEGFPQRNAPESPILILRDSGARKNTTQKEEFRDEFEGNDREGVFYTRIVKLYKQRLRSLMELGFHGRAINKFIAFEDFIEYGEPSVEEIVYQGRLLSGLLAQKTHEQKSATLSSAPKHIRPASSISTAAHPTNKLAPRNNMEVPARLQRASSPAFAGEKESYREFGKRARGENR